MTNDKPKKTKASQTILIIKMLTLQALGSTSGVCWLNSRPGVFRAIGHSFVWSSTFALNIYDAVDLQ